MFWKLKINNKQVSLRLFILYINIYKYLRVKTYNEIKTMDFCRNINYFNGSYHNIG